MSVVVLTGADGGARLGHTAPMDMSLVMLVPALVALAALMVGGALQRVSGMGVGMIAGPTLSLLLGPVAGVSLANVAAVVSAVLLFALLRRHVDWGRFLRLAPLLIVGSFAGAWAVRSLDVHALEVLLGGSVLVAIAASLGLQRRFTASGSAPAALAGTAAGFMNTTAAVAGPALAVYAVASRWEQRSWAATLQPIFLLANLTSLATKSLFGTAVPASVDVHWTVWTAVVVGGPIGVLIGSRIAPREPLPGAPAGHLRGRRRGERRPPPRDRRPPGLTSPLAAGRCAHDSPSRRRRRGAS